MRHSAVACDAYQTTDVANIYDSELQIMLIATRLFRMKNPHWWVQEAATMLTIPNTKAIIEKTIGKRLRIQLFVRP